MKRFSIALAAIGFITSIETFAALPAANQPTLVNVPQLSGGFFVGMSVNFLQPSPTNGDLDYAVVNVSTLPNFHSALKGVEPGYDWGWGINVGYIFPNTGNDVGFNYFHYSGDNSNFVTGTNLNVVNPIISLTGSISNYANAKSEYDIDQVDVFGGQYINVGCRLILHPTIGMRWAQLERDIDGVYIATTSADGLTSVTNTTSDETSDFNGLGAILGLDASYYVAYGFGFVGHFDGGALVDNIQSEINTRQTISGSSTITTNQFKSDDNMRVAPVADAKLGADYTFLLNNSKNSDLTLEAGWQFTRYYRAVDRIYASSIGSTATIIRHNTSDVGFNGPYAYLVFHI